MNREQLKKAMEQANKPPEIISDPIAASIAKPPAAEQKVPRPEGGPETFVTPANYAWQHFVRRTQEMKDRGGRGKKAQMGAMLELFREALDVCSMAQVHLDASFVEGIGARLPALSDKAVCERVSKIMRGEEEIPQKSSIIIPG